MKDLLKLPPHLKNRFLWLITLGPVLSVVRYLILLGIEKVPKNYSLYRRSRRYLRRVDGLINFGGRYKTSGKIVVNKLAMDYKHWNRDNLRLMAWFKWITPDGLFCRWPRLNYTLAGLGSGILLFGIFHGIAILSALFIEFGVTSDSLIAAGIIVVVYVLILSFFGAVNIWPATRGPILERNLAEIHAATSKQ